MRKVFAIAVLFFSLICWFGRVAAQQDGADEIQERLLALSETVPGLKQRVHISVTGIPVKEFLRAIAQSNNLNLNIDPKLNFRIYTNFSNETPINILSFLAKEYNLEISNVGSIITISQGSSGYQNRQIKVNYNPSANTLSLELRADSLPEVARRITQLTGKNIVVTSGLFDKKVSAYLDNIPLETALEKLAFANDIKLNRTSDNVFVFQPLEEGESVFINAEKNTALRKVVKPPGSEGTLALSARTLQGGQKVVSVDAKNALIADLVRAVSSEMNKNYFLYSDIKGALSTNVKDISYDNFLSSLLQGTDYTYKVENGIYLIGERKLEGLRTNRVIQLQNRSVDTIQSMIPNEWKKGVEIKEFREQNTLLLSGSDPQIKEIESFIKQLDQLVPLVLIEVTLIDVRKIRRVKTGLKAGVSDSISPGGTVLPGLDYTLGARAINDFLSRLGNVTSMNLGRVTPNFYVGLSALEENDNVEVRSVPKLSTLNGHSATLSIGSKRYYLIRKQNVFPSFGSTQNIFTDEYVAVEANLAIHIKPIVSGDDQVTLNIKVDISDFIGIPPNNAPPPTSNSKFESIIRAHNEDMIVLGGLERTEKSNGSSGLPLLSRIPVLKWIFSSRNKSNSKVITVVFIKPSIIS